MKLEPKAYSFVKAVERFLQLLAVDTAGKKILIAVSGGVDSCVLLDVLSQLREPLRLNLAVCHINHRLRGSESNEDEAFVIQRTRDYDLPLTVRRFDEPDIERIRGGNLEEQARELRYQRLAHTAEELNYDFIATGHTKSDQAETVLHRMLRTSGVSGLSGILPVFVIHNQTVIRPLLCHSRDDVMDYAQRMNLSYIHDRMNDDEHYTRVRIRHSLLPLLKEQFNPNVEESLSRLAAVCKDEDDFWEQYLDTMQQKIGEGTVHSQSDRHLFLQCAPAEQKRYLRRIFQQAGIDPSYSQITNCLQLIANSKPQGEYHLQDGIHFIRRYTHFFVGQPVQPETLPKPVEIKVPGKTVVPELKVAVEASLRAENIISVKKKSKWQTDIDFDSIKQGLVIRAKKDGDCIQPLGMTGNKKIKKLFQEHALPVEHRVITPLICDGNSVVWIPGMCMSERYKVTPQSRMILQLTAILI